MNQIVPSRQQSILLDQALFEQAQRAGKVMASSPLFPEHLRNGSFESAVANAVLVLNIAYRLCEDPLTVAQNIYFIRGKPGWSTSYMISRVNSSGVFKSPIQWRTVEADPAEIKIGNQKFLNMRVTAWATTLHGEKIEATAGIDTAIAEGWTARSHKAPNQPSKYETMAEHMLRFRTAAMLIRLFCPEVMLGYSFVEELEDMKAGAAEPIDITPAADGEETPTAVAQPKSSPQQPDAAKEVDRKAAQQQYRTETRQQKSTASKTTKTPPASKPPAKVEDAQVVEPDDDEGGFDFDADSLTDELRSLFDQVAGALEDSKDGGEIEQILEMFGDQLEYLRAQSPEAGDAIDAVADEQRERHATGGE